MKSLFSIPLLFFTCFQLFSAQGGGNELFTFGAGGEKSAATDLSLTATVGQPILGRSSSAGSVITSGFLPGLRFVGGPVPVSEHTASEIPKVYALHQNYPNPFNPTTAINYQLPVGSHVTLKIYDLIGREVATLVDVEMPAGRHIATWDAKNAASGVYYYRFVSGYFTTVKRMILMR